MKLKELLKKVKSELRRDAEIIISHLMKVPLSQLPLYYDKELDENLIQKFEEMIKKRKEGIPVAYIIGEWECMGRVFKVKEGVLIPRPETEILIEKTLELIPEDKEFIGYEIGSGTGCISINLLLERKKLFMYAVDVNEVAVKLTLENAKIHKVENRIKVFKGSMFEPVEGMKFNFIVSNPPYIPENFWEYLPKEVKMEGYTSLIGGKKGYEFYEEISKRAKDFLIKGGFVSLEIGHDQGKIVKKLFEEKGFKVNIFKDYSGQDRVVIAKWN